MLKSRDSSSSSLYSLDKNTDEKIESLLKKQFESKQPHIIVPPPPELPESFNSFLTRSIEISFFLFIKYYYLLDTINNFYIPKTNISK